MIDSAANLAQLPRFSYKGDVFTPAEWLEGLILAESSGNPDARRYEKAHDKLADGDYPEADNGVREDDASFGLTQVLGTTLKGRLEATGRMNFSLLFDPLVSIGVGLLEIKQWLLAAYRAHPNQEESELVVRALCKYNGGGNGDAEDPETGDLRGRSYVDLVAKNAKRAQDDRLEKNWHER